MKKVISMLLVLVMLFVSVPLFASAADEDIARMWICTQTSKNTGIKHVFLYFENFSDETIKVGKYNLAPGDEVSVGCFGTEGPRGGGVYYNLESELTHYNSLMAVSTMLDEDELEDVSRKIKSVNRWDPIFNCYYFASRAWNAGAEKDVPFLIFPAFARYFIKMNGGFPEPFNVFAEKRPVYKQTEL